MKKTELEPTGLYYLWGFDDNGKLKYPPLGSFDNIEDLQKDKAWNESHGEICMVGNYWGNPVFFEG